MKFKFDSTLDFQLDAINSVISLFKGHNNIIKEFQFKSETAVIPNEMDLNDETILENLQEIQKFNSIKVSEELEGNDFSIEMETGTGKTYVYLRTLLELNVNYGFKKFIIIVPSVAIKEGVLKTLDITKKHFKNLYNIPYNSYEYDSKKITKIKQFSRNNSIEIMIMTLDSFNKSTNIMNMSHDKFNGRPIDLVSQTRPILILDEPQNMESEISKKAISKLYPLFKLRYSATHKNYYNLLYRLSPVEAYNMGLVKKIEVLSVVKENDFNNVYLKCHKIEADSKGIKAQLELNKKQKSGLKLGKITVRSGDDLFKKSKSAEYKDFMVSKIDARYNFIEFSNGIKLDLGEDLGGDRKKLMEIQIKQTIEEHLRKYQILKQFGIKVLSLFFIDRVANYMDNDGFIRKTFEMEFEKIKELHEDFKNIDVKTVHSGYFSAYKSDSRIKKDKEAFDLIMRDKERLLSFDEPVQFIFSHSALKEGWDNPNVFNICTLNETVSDIKKRQEIGRGIRLPVNQLGDRISDLDFNILTVIANESYSEYVSNLQNGYVDEFGSGTTPPKPMDARKRKTIRLKKRFELNPEFIALWDRINKKTKYSVNIDTNMLIKRCIEGINQINVDLIKIKVEKVTLSLDSDKGIETHFVGQGTEILDKNFSIPNIINEISKETGLTNSSIFEILAGIDNFNLLFKNPQEYLSSVILIIKSILNDFLANGIKYVELNEFWKMELFDNIETYEEKYLKVEKSIYDSLKWDSKGERDFALELDQLDPVKLFIKLPNRFTIDTPIGSYNPDWAIVFEDRDQFGNLKEKLYLVRETKFVDDFKQLSFNEKFKIRCAHEHFKTIDVDYKEINDIKDLL